MPPSLLTGKPKVELIDSRMISAMRLVLASSALLIIYIDPSEPDRYAALAYTILILYTAYSAALYISFSNYSKFAQFIQKWSHWGDVCWYTALIGLSSGANSIFFTFLFFAILVASFRHGFISGLRVTMVSGLLFTIVGFAMLPQKLDINRYLLRTISLLVFGYMMAYWGGYESKLKRRLALLKEVSVLSNPRFGVDRTIGSVLERLRAFYDADGCLLVMFDHSLAQYTLRRATRHNPDEAAYYKLVERDLLNLLLSLPAELSVTYTGPRRFWPRRATYNSFDIFKGKRATEGRETSQLLAGVLDTESFISVPLRYKEKAGRLYLIAKGQAFDHTDPDFLLQVFNHIMPAIENIRLVDQLASDAAREERQRIARDIHDSVIQPYIGLQLGLAGLRERFAGKGVDLTADIERLIGMSSLAVSDLRCYVSELKEPGRREASLLTAVQRFAARFSEATGISVEIEAEANININDRLAAEVFQIVAEGLSNVRRHSQATSATVYLAQYQDNFILSIKNEHTNGLSERSFVPVSITERAETLGGKVDIEPRH